MNYWNSTTMGLIYQVYGTAFFVMGVVVYMLPKRNTTWYFAPHLSLLAAFGILHGVVELIEIERLNNQAEWLTWSGRLLLLASYLPLLEFGRRVWVHIPGKLRLPAPWVYCTAGLGVAMLMKWMADPLVGLMVGARWVVGAPAALLTGLALFTSWRTRGRRSDVVLLRIVALAFICYSLLTLFLSHHNTHLPVPAWIPTQADFLALFGVPIQLLRALCAVVATFGFSALVRQAGESSQVDATAFESQEAIVITDTDTVILRVNNAFAEATGYTAKEAVGRKINILNSGRHDDAFFAAMWESIKNTGTWQGEIWDRRKNGEIYPKWLTITAVKNTVGVVTYYVGTHIDISERKAAENEIKHLAFYDPLTQLPNRRLLRDRLQQTLATSARSRMHGALLFIDLDNFKTLNDTLGHDKGDLLLQQVASRLATCVRECDTVARLGGDEFVILLDNLSEKSPEAAILAEAVGEKILATLNQPYQLADHKHHSTPSIGVTLFSDQDSTIDELLKHADIAMYQAKAAGRNTLRFFDQQMQDVITSRVSLEGELRNALKNQQFQLYYQIQMDSSLRPLGAEALIRWIHPERGLVFPVNFIPLAEETGLILPIGQWVLETACAQIKTWQQDVLTRDLVLAVNVAAKQFRKAVFVSQVKAVVQHSAINPMRLKLELTESVLLKDIEDTATTINALKEIGVQFSLDDFGTGYSSLQYLKKLSLDQLKIDQSFVRNIATDIRDKAIVSTVIAMAHNLNLDVIAEGVETEEQQQFLLSKGCFQYQGYLFGKPVPIEQFNALLKPG